MGLSASQGRMLLLTARKNDLEFRAQQISQQRLVLASELERISADYEEATSNRSMSIKLIGSGDNAAGTSAYYNLNYASLMSGAYNQSGTSGLKSPEWMSFGGDDGMATAGIFRLKDADGNIVISSLDEIPGVETVDGEPKLGEFKTTVRGNVNIEGKKFTFNDGFSSDANISTQDVEESELKEGDWVFDNDGNLIQYTKDKNTGEFNTDQLAVTGNNGGVKLYKKVVGLSGAAKDNLGEYLKTNYYSDNKWQAVEKTESDIYSATGQVEKTAILTKGSNNIYTLTIGTKDDPDYKTVKYRLDTALAGESKQVSDEGTPNYLQECLRNGLYIIERYNINAQNGTEEENKWIKNSFDTISVISDRLYTADDAAAKAKYDRLQNEIEVKDKKLQLELDNIETQRSAVSTEMDSVKKVMDENIEKTFKTFA